MLRHKPYDVYAMYISLRIHFDRDGYDYFKYNGKTNTNEQSYESRGDKYFFERLARKENPQDWLVANLVHSDKFWIGNPEADQIYADWLRRKESLFYSFKTDLQQLDDLNESLRVSNQQHPLLLRLFLGGKVNPETVIVLNQCVDFFPYWNKKLSGDILWKDVEKRLRKYSPFIQCDINKYKDEILKIFS